MSQIQSSLGVIVGGERDETRVRLVKIYSQSGLFDSNGQPPFKGIFEKGSEKMPFPSSRDNELQQLRQFTQ